LVDGLSGRVSGLECVFALVKQDDLLAKAEILDLVVDWLNWRVWMCVWIAWICVRIVWMFVRIVWMFVWIVRIFVWIELDRLLARLAQFDWLNFDWLKLIAGLIGWF